MNLPGYSPDFNADEAVWGWAREEVTGNLCLGSRAAVQERVGKIPGRAVQPERRGETALPDGPAIKGRNTPRETPAPIPNTRQMHIPPWLWFSCVRAGGRRLHWRRRTCCAPAGRLAPSAAWSRRHPPLGTFLVSWRSRDAADRTFLRHEMPLRSRVAASRSPWLTRTVVRVKPVLQGRVVRGLAKPRPWECRT